MNLSLAFDLSLSMSFLEEKKKLIAHYLINIYKLKRFIEEAFTKAR